MPLATPMLDDRFLSLFSLAMMLLLLVFLRWEVEEVVGG